LRIRLSFIVILVFLLSACGPAATPEPTETPAAPEPTETPAQVQEGEAETSGPPTDFQGVDYTTTDSGLQVAITEEGDGEQPETGDVVSVHYTGMLDDGTIFDSSRNRGEPFRFPLGRGRVIPGWDEGVSLLREGGTVPFRTNAYEFSGPTVQFGTSNLQTTTEDVLVTDVVEYELPCAPSQLSPLGRPFLEALFAYRHRRTRRLLE
jgi:peptidylprolyl isomerase